MLIIGIGYTKSLRDPWHSVKCPIKRAYISYNPLVAATLPDLDRMKAYDYERKEYAAPSNLVKRYFLCAVCTEYYKSPCKVFTVNILEDKIRVPSVISKYELQCNINREKLIQHMISPECN